MEVFLIKALQLIASLSLLVIVHEFGHFIFARLFKVRVEKFYLFFNPWFSLFKYKPKNSDTTYGIGWLPLGGYVKIAGMIDESMDKEQMEQPEQPWEFRTKPAWQRLLIMAAGVIFNFVLALMIYSMITFKWGDNYLALRDAKAGMEFSQTAENVGFRDGDILLTADGVPLEQLDGETVRAIAAAATVTVQRADSTLTIAIPADFMKQLIGSNEPFASYINPVIINEVVGGGTAAAANMQVGDSIVAINEVITRSIPAMITELKANCDKKVLLSFYRKGNLMQDSISVSSDGRIGIALRPITDIYTLTTIKYGFFESIPVGISRGIAKLKSYVGDFKYIFTKEGAGSLGGFGTLGSIFPAVWNWHAFWEVTAFLSIALAFMNILPIPALDGGHIFFLIYEVITRRKPNDKFMEYAQTVGMLLLFALLIYANGNDIIRFFSK